jgi:hypothetical protein
LVVVEARNTSRLDEFHKNKTLNDIDLILRLIIFLSLAEQKYFSGLARLLFWTPDVLRFWTVLLGSFRATLKPLWLTRNFNLLGKLVFFSKHIVEVCRYLYGFCTLHVKLCSVVISFDKI